VARSIGKEIAGCFREGPVGGEEADLPRTWALSVDVVETRGGSVVTLEMGSSEPVGCRGSSESVEYKDGVTS